MPKTKKQNKQGNTKTEKVVKKVVKEELNRELETKYHDTTLGTATAIDYNGSVQAVTNAAQGVTDQTRIGDKLQPIGIDIRMNAYVGLSSCTIRTIIFRWKAQSTIDVLNVPNILLSTLVGTINGVNSPYNWDNRAKFDILYDKTMKLYSGSTGNQQTVIKIRKNLKHKKVNFYGGSATDCMNGLYIIFLSDTTLVNSPNISAISRLYYKDG